MFCLIGFNVVTRATQWAIANGLRLIPKDDTET